MKFTTYQSDLQILPENEEEITKFVNYCKEKDYVFSQHYSNVKGQDWHGKYFFELPFLACMQKEIEEYIK